jgi:hypothetical protein
MIVYMTSTALSLNRSYDVWPPKAGVATDYMGQGNSRYIFI